MGDLLRFSPFSLPGGEPSLQTDWKGDWVSWKDAKERIAALEADCRDMAEDVLTYAKEQYGDGDGGIHPALHHRWRRDTETARKYRPEALGEVDRGC